MKDNKYLDDISEIKSIMDRSTRFLSLSGKAGILAGIYAIIGSFTANYLINSYLSGGTDNYVGFIPLDYFEIILLALAGLVLFAAVLTAYILTSRKAKKNNETIWSPPSKRMIMQFSIPLITGGILCIVLYQYNLIGLIAPLTLIFYGLACIHASKYTLGDIYYLGWANLILGLVATQFIGYGLYFWAFGFGLLHIIYGAMMYKKYD